MSDESTTEMPDPQAIQNRDMYIATVIPYDAADTAWQNWENYNGVRPPDSGLERALVVFQGPRMLTTAQVYDVGLVDGFPHSVEVYASDHFDQSDQWDPFAYANAIFDSVKNHAQVFFGHQVLEFNPDSPFEIQVYNGVHDDPLSLVQFLTIFGADCFLQTKAAYQSGQQ